MLRAERLRQDRFLRATRVARVAWKHLVARGSAAPPPCHVRPAGPWRDRRPSVPGEDRGSQRNSNCAVRCHALQSKAERKDRIAGARLRLMNETRPSGGAIANVRTAGSPSFFYSFLS